MTIDERIEFLIQSIESHDRQIGELVERMDKAEERMDHLAERVDRTTANIDALGTTVEKLAQTTQLSFDRLTTAMPGLTQHVSDHQRRIEELER
jgi:chromosome segregation ATPase